MCVRAFALVINKTKINSNVCMFNVHHTCIFILFYRKLCRNLCTLHVTRMRVVFIACLSFYSLFYDDQACVKGARRAAGERGVLMVGSGHSACERERQRVAAQTEKRTLSCAERGTKQRLVWSVWQKVCIVTVKRAAAAAATKLSRAIAMHVMRL